MSKKRKFQDRQVPAKKQKLNNRVFFEDNVEEEEVKENVGKFEGNPSVSPKNQQKSINPKSSLILENYQPRKFPTIWPYLEIHGPLPKITSIGSELIKNRSFVMFFREFTGKIHENFLKFRETVMKEVQNRRGVPEIEEILRILMKMFNETMKFDNVVLNVLRILESIPQVFVSNSATLDANNFPALLDQLRDIFVRRQFVCSEESILTVRNAILRHLFLVSVDFITCVISRNSDARTNRTQIQGFRCFDIFPNQYLQSRTDFEFMMTCSSFRSFFQNNHLLRSDENVSLWMAIPCEHEDNEHLLEYVFELGLIRLLPEKVRRFLTDWMIGVRKRMRKRLKKGDLRRAIEAIIQGNGQKSLRMKMNDKKICTFLKQINENVLNCVDNFDVFGGKWADSVIHLVQYPAAPHAVPMNTKLTSVLKNSGEETPATIHLSSLFSESLSDQCLLSHTLLQLYRFLMYFSYATLRHVFYPSNIYCYVYFNWKLEEEITDFEDIKKYERTIKEKRGENPIHTEPSPPQQTIVPTPSKMEFRNVSHFPPSFNPCVPPSTNMPNYMRIVPPVTFNQPYFVGNPSEIHQFQPEIGQTWTPMEQQRNQFAFRPLPPTPLYLPTDGISLKSEPMGADRSREVAEWERALGQHSEVSGGRLNPMYGEFENVPKQSMNADRLRSEEIRDLKADLEKMKNRLEQLS